MYSNEKCRNKKKRSEKSRITMPLIPLIGDIDRVC